MVHNIPRRTAPSPPRSEGHKVAPPTHPADSEVPTLFSSLMLFDHAAFARGRKEKEASLKYLLSKSGHTRRMLTTSSATSSSSAAVFSPSRKCRSVRFPPLQRNGQQGLSRRRARGDHTVPSNFPRGTEQGVLTAGWRLPRQSLNFSPLVPSSRDPPEW